MFLRVSHSSGLQRRDRCIERAIELDVVPLEATEILDFVVGLSRLPAAPQDSYPFESQLADRHPFTLSVFQLVLIEQAGPVAFSDGALRKFYDALMKKDRASIAEMNCRLVAALSSHRGHPAEAQQVERLLEIGLDGPKGRCPGAGSGADRKG